MTYEYENFEIGRYTVRIVADDYAKCPYDEWDMFGTMYHWHKRGFFGEDYAGNQDDLQEIVNNTEKTGGVVVPVYLYEHSGQTISAAPFSCPWDSGVVGVWIATAEQVKNEFGGDADRARKCILGEIETMYHYLRGNVFGFVVEDEEGDTLESCWGFYGWPDESGVIDEAKLAAEHLIEQDRKKHQEHVKTMIRNRVPLEDRA